MTPASLVKMLQSTANLASAWLDVQRIRIEIEFAERELRIRNRALRQQGWRKQEGD